MGIQQYLHETYGARATYLPYGANLTAAQPEAALRPFNLDAGNYHLVIARMEPENHVQEIIEAHLEVDAAPKLVLVGSLDTGFGPQLEQYTSSNRLLFAGALFDKPLLDALRQHAALYLHGHSVGGTNPSLLEAMAAGALIAAHNNPFNRAILGEQAAYFSDAPSLAKVLRGNWVQEHQQFRAAHQQTIAQQFTWTTIIDQYEAYFQRIA